jgi:hypothetical protein
MIAAFLKAGAEDQLINYHSEFNEHLGPSAENVRIAGVLRSPQGTRRGYLALYESDRIEEAESWLRESPFYEAHLYDRVDVYEYQIQVGQLG